MAPLASDAVSAAMNLALHDDAAAATGAQDDTEHNAEAGTGAIGRLAQCKAVGIVLDPYFPSERIADVAVEAVAVEGDGVGVLHRAGGWANDARNADSNRHRDAQSGFGFAHEADDCCYSVLVSARRGDAVPQRFAAIRGEHCDFDFSAAQVDARSISRHRFRRIGGPTVMIPSVLRLGTHLGSVGRHLPRLDPTLIHDVADRTKCASTTVEAVLARTRRLLTRLLRAIRPEFSAVCAHRSCRHVPGPEIGQTTGQNGCR